eukprot:TRINITY_DN3552_c0_g1_i1.p1 TRINITY_DN3552_c0_g1~~TRINITY_DN3552_c0_g1_i1.p1  ORF type:complete len:192 (+),score=45.39 TRINITY_DN3552_c0_g1_i1:13-588(+)
MKRSADDAEEETKKSKTDDKEDDKEDDKAEGGDDKPEYTYNMNKALDKAHEGKSFTEIIKLPPSALQGLADKADAMLKAFKIETIEDLANWKFFKLARAIQTLSEVEEEGKRSEEAEFNINAALDKEWETKSFKDILKGPPSAFSGLAEWTDTTLKELRVKTIGSVARWKYCRWAEAFVTLAKYEKADHSS